MLLGQYLLHLVVRPHVCFEHLLLQLGDIAVYRADLLRILMIRLIEIAQPVLFLQDLAADFPMSFAFGVANLLDLVTLPVAEI